MSESTQEHTGRNRNRGDAHPPVGVGHVTKAPESVVVTDLGTVTIEIADLEVTLGVKFGPGHVLTDNQAKVLDAAYQRQFTNNQNAMAKSRAERLAKATTDAEREANAPLSAEALATLYATYEPTVGGAVRMSTLDKIKSDAAWRVWVAMVGEHNEAIKASQPSPVFKTQTLQIVIPVRKVGDQTVEQYREATVATMLAAKSAKVQERIQTAIDAIQAERGTPKAKPEGAVVVASADDFA